MVCHSSIHLYAGTDSVGRLGVTPVTIGGLIVIKPADDEIKYLCPAKSISISIRCTETRYFGSKEERVLWEKTKVFWTPSTGEYEDLDRWSSRFSISIPPNAMEVARSAQLTKDWKVEWKLHLVVAHRPIPCVGETINRSYSLNVWDHISPSIPPPSPPQAMSVGNDAFSSQVSINPQHGAFGPGDSFPVSFHVKPDDAGTTIKKASIFLERRYEKREREPSPPRTEKTSRFRISPRPIYSRLSSGSDTPDKCLVHKLFDVTTNVLTPGSGGTFWGNIMFNLPKRSAQWDIGETCTTELVNISFTIRVKLWIKSGRSTKEIVCPGVPIILTGVSSAERLMAQTEAAALVPPTPTKRKHSSRRGMYMQEGTTGIHEEVNGVGRRIPSKPKSKSIKSNPPSPILPISGVVTGLRPILRQADQPPIASSSGPSIRFQPLQPSRSTVDPTFAFPTPPMDGHPDPPILPPIQSLLDAAPPTYESYSILHDFQQNGRRISNTASEEDEQPSRSRQRLAEGLENQEFDYRRGLPSLDALGLGLPVLPDHERPRSRPRTAPLVSTFQRYVPPPLSGQVSPEVDDPEMSQVRPVSMATTQAPAPERRNGRFAFRPPTSRGPQDRRLVQGVLIKTTEQIQSNQ
jgi:hypothetical protein